MDPHSITEGVMQNVSHCSTCGVIATRWLSQIKNVDPKLQGFSDQISALQSTHVRLKRSLETPSMIEAARNINVSDGQLWTQVSRVLGDCKDMVIALAAAMGRVRLNRIGRPERQLMESLRLGELAPYFERMWMFDGTLELVLDMISVIQQLGRRDLTESELQGVRTTIASITLKIERISNRVDLRRPVSSGEQHIAPHRNGKNSIYAPLPRFIYSNVDICIKYAKEYMATVAAAAASLRGAASEGVYPSGNQIRRREVSSVHTGAAPGHGRGSQNEQSPSLAMPPQQEHWHQQYGNPDPQAQTQSHKLPTPDASEHGNGQSELYQTPDQFVAVEMSVDKAMNLSLAQTHVEAGQKEMEQREYEMAEEDFREALHLLENEDVSANFVFQSTDVVLMLAHCLYMLGKHEEAIEWLLPVSDPTHTASATQAPAEHESAQMHAADHLLGLLYRSTQDYARAERYALSAYKGRRSIFRPDHTMTIDSAHLVVEIYTEMGRGAKARAFAKAFLPQAPHVPASPTLQSPVLDAPTFGGSIQNAQPVEISPFNRGQSIPDGDASTASLPARIDTTPLVAHVDMPPEQKHALHTKFMAVQAMANESKDKAMNMAIKLLKKYDPEPSQLLLHHTREIRRNIERRGANLGLAATGSGYAPIHFFCELSNCEAVVEVQFLIDQGVDLTAPRFAAGWRRAPLVPLQLAIEKGHENIALAIVGAFMAAAQAGRPVVDVNSLKDGDNFSPLMSACRKGFVRLVEKLLEYGASIPQFPNTWYGNSLLHDACCRCDTEMVKLLLQYQEERAHHRQDIGSLSQADRFGLTPLMYAVATVIIPSETQRRAKLANRCACVQLLLEYLAARPSFENELRTRDQKGRDVFSHVLAENDVDLQELVERYLRTSRAEGPPRELEANPRM